MDKRRRRRRRKNTIRDIMDMVKTILLVMIAVVVVIFVVLFIKGNLGSSEGTSSKMDIFSSVFKGKETIESEEETVEEPEEDLLSDGFHQTEEGKLYYCEDGKKLSAQWMDRNKKLYRIGEDGFLVTGTYAEDGYLYTFTDSGMLTSIAQDPDYEDKGSEPGLIKDGGLSVYLDPSEKFGRFSSIVYKKSSVSHKLGGTGNLQYTMAGSLQTDQEGCVYWLPYVSDPDEMEKRISRKLYRMQPGTSERQIVAEEVDGYRVVTGENGETVIYYCKKGGMYRCGLAALRVDDEVFDFTEDMEYRLEVTEDGKLVLETENGYPVTKASDSFHTLGMAYAISETGEVLSREDSIYVKDGVLEVSVGSDEIFGQIRSRVVREDATGDRYYISGEFSGECHSLYLNPADGRIYGEYVSAEGIPGIVSITMEGDVDLILGTPAEIEFLELYGFTDEGAVIKVTDYLGESSFKTVSLTDSSPLALGTDPVKVEEGPGSSVTDGPGYGPEASSEEAGYGPGDLPAPTPEIPEEPVTVSF